MKLNKHLKELEKEQKELEKEQKELEKEQEKECIKSWVFPMSLFQI